MLTCSSEDSPGRGEVSAGGTTFEHEAVDSGGWKK